LFRQSACLTCQVRCRPSWMVSFRLIWVPSNCYFFILFSESPISLYFTYFTFYPFIFTFSISDRISLFLFFSFLLIIFFSYGRISKFPRLHNQCTWTQSTKLRQKNYIQYVFPTK
jgi:hypothetical protein